MTFRESLNNAVRSDRPESPTDMAFIFLVVIMGGLWIMSNIRQNEFVALVIMVAFVGSLKMIKVGSDMQKKRKAVQDVKETLAEDKTVQE